MVFLGASAMVGVRSAELACSAEDADYVQLTIQTLDTGVQVFEAFRVAASGRAEWGRWDNEGHLLGHVQPKSLERSFYATLKAGASGGTAGQAGEGNALMFSVAAVSAGGRSFASYDTLPAALAPAVSYLRRMLPPGNTLPGKHLWLLPQAGGGAIDIELGQVTCPKGSMARAVSNAMSAGLMVVPIESAISRSFVAQRPSRWAFGARSAGGYTLFGVVSAN